MATYKDYGQNKTTDMKTEPIGAMRERTKKLFEITAEDVTAIEAAARRNEIIALAAFEKGQSSPKIKQLDWDFYGTYYSAETPVGHYVILEGDEQYLENYTTCTLTYNGNLIADFNSIKEAQSAAQADFEKRVKECL